MSFTILLRSSWQTVNIGDVAHTPGVLRVLERFIPEASVILWPTSLDRGVEPMLRRRFPRLRIVRDAPKWQPDLPRADDPTIAEAIAEADLLLHGSGPELVGLAEIRRWQAATRKPYGAFGVTLGSAIGATDGIARFSPAVQDAIDGAAFIFTRETRSLDALRATGTRCPITGFVPDGTFATDLRDEMAADQLMAEAGLTPGEFLCAIPRLRITPYWDIHQDLNIPPDEIVRRKAVNAQHAEPDHAKLRTAIIGWVRRTGRRVLICPEMAYQVDIIRPLVFDPLPPDVKPHVYPISRYWLTNEAASIYARARVVLSMECHSPILAIASGKPAVYLRQPTDTWKGQMYPDLGLAEWAMDIDAVSGNEVTERVLQIDVRYERAIMLARTALARAEERFREACTVVVQAARTAPR